MLFLELSIHAFMSKLSNSNQTMHYPYYRRAQCASNTTRLFRWMPSRWGWSWQGL